MIKPIGGTNKMKCSIKCCGKKATDIIYVEMYIEIAVCEYHFAPLAKALTNQRKEIISRKIDSFDK